MTRSLLGYELFGRGPEPVVLLHDFYGSRRTWDFARPFLDPEGFTYAFAEMRGYGLSREIAGEYTIREAAGDVLALATALGWGRFHLVGHSISGMVAQRVLVDGGARVISAVLNTPVHATGLAFPGDGLALVEASLSDDAKLAEAFDVLTGGRLGEGWREFKVRQAKDARDRDARAQAAYMRDAQTGFLDEARGLETPVRVLIGEYDIEPFTPDITKTTLLQWYPNTHMPPIDGAAHYPQQEAPACTAARIVEFQRAHAGAATT